MIDLHTHTLFSDGELIPSELARRAVVKGYTALAMTDHGDLSNLDLIIPRLLRVSVSLTRELYFSLPRTLTLSKYAFALIKGYWLLE